MPPPVPSPPHASHPLYPPPLHSTFPPLPHHPPLSPPPHSPFPPQASYAVYQAIQEGASAQGGDAEGGARKRARTGDDSAAAHSNNGGGGGQVKAKVVELASPVVNAKVGPGEGPGLG